MESGNRIAKPIPGAVLAALPTGGELFRIVSGVACTRDDDNAFIPKNKLDQGYPSRNHQVYRRGGRGGYDMVFPGFPHNGSSVGAGSLGTLKKLLPSPTVRTGSALSVTGNSISGAENKAGSWLSGIGYKK